jgi:hypothetical protein
LAGVLSPLVQAMASEQEALRRADALARARLAADSGQPADDHSSEDSGPALIDPVCLERDRTVRTVVVVKNNPATLAEQLPTCNWRHAILPPDSAEGLPAAAILRMVGPHRNHAPHAPPAFARMA